MPCSQRKIEANRRNAQKSTGPRTADGKARSSRNAISHGLTAQLTPVVLDESQSEFDAFAQELFDDLRPRGAMQRMIVDRIIFMTWKLRRIPRIERTLFSARPAVDDGWGAPHPDVPPEEVAELRRLLDDGEPQNEQNEPTASVGDAMGFNEKQVRFMQLYEMRLERSLHANLRELARLKQMKNEATEDEDLTCGVGASPTHPVQEQSVGEAPTPQEIRSALRESSAFCATPADAKSADFKNSSDHDPDAPVRAPDDPHNAPPCVENAKSIRL